MTPDEVRRMRTDEVLIFTRGQPPIRAQQLQYHAQPYFKKLAAIAPPPISDRMITAPPVEDERKKTDVAVGSLVNDTENGLATKIALDPKVVEGDAHSDPRLGFLKFAAEGAGSAAPRRNQ
jgi:type IV secretory pathway TraG/TraD family ATPase VirD4